MACMTFGGGGWGAVDRASDHYCLNDDSSSSATLEFHNSKYSGVSTSFVRLGSLSFAHLVAVQCVQVRHELRAGSNSCRECVYVYPA